MMINDKIDRGKAQALRDAGWTPEEIAEELSVSADLILAITHKPEPRKHYQNEWREQEPAIVRSPDLI